MTRLGDGKAAPRSTVSRLTTPSLGRRLIYAMVPLFMLLTAALFVSEIVLRIRFDGTARITGAARWQTAEFGGFTYQWDRYHPLLGWTNLPSYESDASIPFAVTINSQGLRASHDYAPRAAPEVKRIALFGDSLAFGEEVNSGQTLADHLEGMNENWEVLNYGVHGYSFGQSVLRLEHEGHLLQPDHYLVTVLFPEDIIRDGVSHFVHAKPVFRSVDGSLEIDNIPVPEASRVPLLMRHSYAAAWLFGRRGSWHRGSVDDEGDIDVGHAIARHAAKVCRVRGRPLTIVVMLAPAGVQRYVSDPIWRERFDVDRASFMDLDLEILDLVPRQETAFIREGRTLFSPIAHWSSRGNRLWAEWIAEQLEGRETEVGSVSGAKD